MRNVLLGFVIGLLVSLLVGVGILIFQVQDRNTLDQTHVNSEQQPASTASYEALTSTPMYDGATDSRDGGKQVSVPLTPSATFYKGVPTAEPTATLMLTTTPKPTSDLGISLDEIKAEFEPDFEFEQSEDNPFLTSASKLPGFAAYTGEFVFLHLEGPTDNLSTVQIIFAIGIDGIDGLDIVRLIRMVAPAVEPADLRWLIDLQWDVLPNEHVIDLSRNKGDVYIETGWYEGVGSGFIMITLIPRPELQSAETTWVVPSSNPTAVPTSTVTAISYDSLLLTWLVQEGFGDNWSCKAYEAHEILVWNIVYVELCQTDKDETLAGVQRLGSVYMQADDEGVAIDLYLASVVDKDKAKYHECYVTQFDSFQADRCATVMDAMEAKRKVLRQYNSHQSLVRSQTDPNYNPLGD